VRNWIFFDGISAVTAPQSHTGFLAHRMGS